MHSYYLTDWSTTDTFCGEHSEIELIAQIGKSKYEPKNFEAREQLSIAGFDQLFEQASLIISHAGI